MVKLPEQVSDGRRVGLGFLGCAAAIFLTACATTSEPRIVVKEVKVPVPVACAASPGPDPAFSDTPEALRAAADVFQQVRLLLAGRAQRDGRIAELKGAVAGCG
jgi:hypothetical protein